MSFNIYNYLPHHSIRLEAQGKNKEETVSFVRILPKQGKEIAISEAIKYFHSGRKVKIYIREEAGDEKTRKTECYSRPGLEQFYTEVVLDTKKDQLIKALHVGQITTRLIGGKRQNSGLATSSNAVQGCPFVDIHNMTAKIIRLGDVRFGIEIPPNGYFRFSGTDHFGVRLGTIFRDNDKIYPDFQLLRPVTDIYYGLVSDIQNPTYGGWQMEFDSNPEEASYLFADGWY